MRDSFDRMLYRVHIKLCYEKMQEILKSLGQGGHYNDEQEKCALS